MSYIGNSPQSETILRLEARKSFALGLELRDSSSRPLDVTGVVFKIVAKKSALDPLDADNIISNNTAEHLDDVGGVVRFNFQASDLDEDPGEYPFVIVMTDSGYSSVITKGVVDILANTEYASVGGAWTGANPPISLIAELEGARTLQIFTGPTLAPGSTSYTILEQAKLDAIEAGAQVNVQADWEALDDESAFILNKPDFGTAAFYDVENIAVPPVGTPGNVLMKIGTGPTEYAWATPTAVGGGNLVATGVGAGRVPIANGANSWAWSVLPPSAVTSVNGGTGAVTLTLENIADGATRLAMTVAERAKLASLSPAWVDITGKPSFGTASLSNTGDFLPSTGIAGSAITSGTVPAARLPKVSTIPGFSSGTSAPAGGADGDLYFQYT